jgi:hypothetical protein
MKASLAPKRHPGKGQDTNHGRASAWPAWRSAEEVGSEKLRQLRTLTAADKTSSVRSICHTLGISKATFYRYLNS